MTDKLKQIVQKINPRIDFQQSLYLQFSSLELVQLITLLESTYKISFLPNDIDEYLFFSIVSIEELLKQKIIQGDDY